MIWKSSSVASQGRPRNSFATTTSVTEFVTQETPTEGISMKIGFIGAGIVAQTVSKHVIPFGHQVLLSNSRGPDSLVSLIRELGPGATAGTPQEAAAQDMVVLAVNWSSVQTALFSIADWKGRIL